MKYLLAFCLLFASLFAYAQMRETTADSLFLKGSASLLDGNFTLAEDCFTSAKNGYLRIRNQTKVNECSMALATIQFFKGNFEQALRMFEKLRREHLSAAIVDTEGLKLIDHNIKFCQSELQNLKLKKQ